jgi:DNA-binding GntR family transcriptional regulator
MQVAGVQMTVKSELKLVGKGSVKGAGLVPVARSTVHEQVYAQLSDVLRRGELEAGETLSLRSLAGLLGVSIMPVRDAVGRLVNEGVLELMPNRQVRVPLLTIQQYQSLTEARVAAEGHAAYLAAQRIGGAELTLLLAANERLIQAAERKDHAEIMQANQDVHFTIYRAARSPKLLHIIESLWKQCGPYLASIEVGMASTHEMSEHDFGAAQHARMHAALADHDPARARQMLVEDIEGFANIFRELLSRQGVGAEGRVERHTTSQSMEINDGI